jgi:hypothetical protein
MSRATVNHINFLKYAMKTIKQTLFKNHLSAQIVAVFFIAFLCGFQYSKKKFYLKQFQTLISTCLPNTTIAGSLNE